MDIAGLSTSMATMSLQNQVGVAMLDKMMDVNETIGAGLVQMMDAAAMEQSVNPHIGGNMDIRI